ncbi:hypothetical protein [uncultured Tessaracoccus sp.]|uniref:hypothetical protein n=1 Tax=uncultured Tessaracoccus sp. TaxID=905023 RepID=UPI0025E60DA4|nr:hypothetical protein [uncultured Tessaracoccus sp.]
MEIRRAAAWSLVLAVMGLPLTASTARAEWHDGLCQRGEGVTVIIDWSRLDEGGGGDRELLRCVVLEDGATTFPVTDPTGLNMASVLRSAGVEFSMDPGYISDVNGIPTPDGTYWHFTGGKEGQWLGKTHYDPQPEVDTFTGIALGEYGTDPAPVRTPEFAERDETEDPGDGPSDGPGEDPGDGPSDGPGKDPDGPGGEPTGPSGEPTEPGDGPDEEPTGPGDPTDGPTGPGDSSPSEEPTRPGTAPSTPGRGRPTASDTPDDRTQAPTDARPGEPRDRADRTSPPAGGHRRDTTPGAHPPRQTPEPTATPSAPPAPTPTPSTSPGPVEAPSGPPADAPSATPSPVWGREDAERRAAPGAGTDPGASPSGWLNSVVGLVLLGGLGTAVGVGLRGGRGQPLEDE